MIERTGTEPLHAAAREQDAISTAVARTLWRHIPSALVATGLVVNPALAQTQSVTPLIEEIVVTAQKRAESILDVPISLSVIGAEELDALRAQAVDDYILMIPNSTFIKAGNFAPDITLRGISAAAGGLFDPIGVTVDDAGFGATNTSTILSSRLLDVERVEVLRGPQGTLSGRNSLGGTINIISIKPDPQAFEAKVDLEYARFNTVISKGVVNTPISDTLALRTVGFYENSDGAVDNIGPAGGSSDTDNAGGRVAMRWLASDALTIDASVGYEEQRYGFDTALPIDRYFDEDRADRIAALADLGGNYADTDFLNDAGEGKVRMDVPEFTTITDWIGSFRAAYTAGSHQFDLIYGHFDFEARALVDDDKSEYAVRRRERFRDATADSAELRWTTSFSGPVNWVAGLSYSTEENPARGGTQEGDGALGGSYVFRDAFSDFQEIRSEGVFANVFWDVTERLHLSAGGRYSREKTSFGAVFTSDETEPLGAIPSKTAELTEFSPRVALTFDVLDTLSVYAQFATGYRAGYGADPQAIALGLVAEEVESESVRNYEAGIKGRFLDGRLTLAASMFHMDYEDLQVFDYLYQDESYIYLDFNAGEAYARGFEIEVAALPLDGLELRASVGYVDTEVEEVPYYGEILEDVEIPATRPWTASASASYTHEVGAGWNTTWRADFVWQDQAFASFARQLAEEQPQFETLNLSVRLTDGRWAVTGYFDNVLDETYWLSTTTGQSLRGTFATYTPRTYGLRVSYRWGGT
jgi:iron complex outermembrane receptor protein